MTAGKHNPKTVSLVKAITTSLNARKAMKRTKVQVHTTSNFAGLNGQWLDVVEDFPTGVTCKPLEGRKKPIGFLNREITDYSSK